MKYSTILVATTLIAFAAIICAPVISNLLHPRSEKPLGEASLPFNTATNTSVDCGSSSTQVVATSTGRQYLAIVNDSSSTVYLGLGVAAVGSVGMRLNANGGTWESLAGQNIFTGAVYCVASSTARLTVVQN